MTGMNRRRFLQGLASLPLAAKLIEFDGGIEAVAERLPEESVARVWPEPETPGESYIPPSKPAPGPGVSIFYSDSGELLAQVRPSDVANAEVIVTHEPVPYSHGGHMVEYLPGHEEVTIKLELYETDTSYHGGLWKARRDGRLWEGGEFDVLFDFEGKMRTRVREAILLSAVRSRDRNAPDFTRLEFACRSRGLIDWEVPS